MASSPHNGPRTDQSLQDFEDKMRRAWENASKKEYASVGKDLPRLANRTSILVIDNGQLVKDGILEAKAEHEVASGLNCLTTVIYTVAKELESSDVVDKLLEPLASLSAKMIEDVEKKTLDLQMETQTIMNKYLENTKTVRVFQAIHQQIIFPCVERLKLTAMQGMEMTKDVRGSDGWKVEIEISPKTAEFGGAVSVMHVRREQSLHPEASPSHWEFEYSVRMVFDLGMEQMKSVMLRINHIKFHPEMPQAEKDAIHCHITEHLIV
jgi:hypothetical protein